MKTRVVVDSSKTANLKKFNNSLVRALGHFGVWHETIDLASAGISGEPLEKPHLLILAQEGTGNSLTDPESEVILNAVKNGKGLVVLDGDLKEYVPAFEESVVLNFPAR